jgi:predicted kinase
MKTLSLARPLILILVGLPGAGKSFFARQFSEMFGAPMVSYDRMRFELFAKTQLSQSEHDIVHRIANYQMEELVKTHRSFLIDGGASALADRQKLEQVAKKHGYGTLVIWVQTDEVTSKSRATKRNPKRPDDAFSPSITDTAWREQAKRFVLPTREAYMVISGKHAFSTQAKMVLRKLTTPHVQEAETAHQRQQTSERKPVAPRRSTEQITVQRPRQTGTQTPTRRNVVIS